MLFARHPDLHGVCVFEIKIQIVCLNSRGLMWDVIDRYGAHLAGPKWAEDRLRPKAGAEILGSWLSTAWTARAVPDWAGFFNFLILFKNRKNRKKLKI